MKDKKKNIFIIGYMGSGKTTVGEVLAQLTNRDFMDMEMVIEKEQSMPVRTMFMKYGEHSFRNHEAQLLDKLVAENDTEYSKKNNIISCESGIIQDDANLRILDEQPVVWLDCDPDIMYERISKNPFPPYAYFYTGERDACREIFISQYKQRKDSYRKVSNITVNTGSGASPQEIGEEIIRGIE